MVSAARSPFVLAALAGLVPGCGPAERPSEEFRNLPLAIVDTNTGRITAEWEAPERLFDVAVDPVTGRVWGVADSSWYIYDGMPGPMVYELYPDQPPRPIYEMGMQWLDPSTHLQINRQDFLDYGNIALDPVNRRGLFTSPTTWETVLLDLDTDRRIKYYYGGGSRIHSNAFWDEGLGYFTGGGYGAAIRSSDGEVLGVFCSLDFPQHAAAISQPRDELYIVQGYTLMCIVHLDTFATEEWEIPCNANSWNCLAVGTATHPDGRRLYLAMEDYSGADITTIGVFDAETRTWREVLDRSRPHGFAVSPDGRRLYVTERICRRIGVYDADSLDRIADIPMEGNTLGIDLSADGQRLFVTQAADGTPLGSDGFDLGDPFCPALAPPLTALE